MKMRDVSHRRWLRGAIKRSQARFWSGPRLPLPWLLWLPICFLLGIGAGLLWSPNGLIHTLAAGKDLYQQSLSPTAPQTTADSRTSRTGPVDADGGLLILPAQEADSAQQPAGTPTTPLVCVYCSHAGEEYQGETRVNGQAGGVMRAAASLVEALENRGVGVVFDETLHDSPSYDNAYGSSLASITQIHEQYPTVQVYVDVHRDSAIEGVSTTLDTENGSYARMMFIIGTDEKLDHPLWRENYDFALQLDATLNQLVPDVTREPRVYSGRYNQHISTGAILVEVGSTDNTVEEAQRSAALLAEAICQVKGW